MNTSQILINLNEVHNYLIKMIKNVLDFRLVLWYN